jgi:hypothetical protein
MPDCKIWNVTNWPVLQGWNGDADEADDEDVETEDDDVGGGDEEHLRPEVELLDL